MPGSDYAMKSLVVLGPRRVIMWCQPRRIAHGLQDVSGHGACVFFHHARTDALGDLVHGVARPGNVPARSLTSS